MSGIGMVMNTARLAIAAQQKGLSVTSHNIANVNSPYYSRQSAVYSPRDPVSYGEYWLGSGVEVTAVTRSADQLLENRLIDIKSDLASSEELASYMDIFETSLNENSESGISTIMVEFWNAWQGVSNNPTGASERVAVYEKGLEAAERFDTLTNDLLQIESDLNSEISSILTEVGSLSSQIAVLNNELISQEVTNISSDMLDQRNGLVTQLAKLIGINTFEQPDGSLTANVAGGFSLVSGASALSLTFDSGRLYWEGSFGGQVDITDEITGGKIGGWLEMRDEVIAKYRTELDALAHEFIWTVNYQHSQGVGLDYFDSAVTGTYATDASGRLDTLAFGDKIDYTGEFKLWAADSTGASAASDVSVDMSISTSAVSNWAGAGDANSTYRFTVITAGTAEAGGGADPVLSWEKIDNTTGVVTPGGGNITISDVNTFAPDPFDGTLTFDIAAGSLVAGNTFTVTTDGAGVAIPVTLDSITGNANSILDTYKFSVTSTTGNGKIGAVGDTITIDWSNSVTNGSFTLDETTTDVIVDGMTISFDSGVFADGDSFTIETDSTGSPTEHMMSDWHWTLDSFADEFNTQAIAANVNVRADTTTAANKITFDFVAGAYDGFAFSDDTVSDSGLAAALGINSFFTGYDCQTMSVNSVLEDRDLIAAATIDATTGEFGVGDNSNALNIADLKFSTRSIAEWTYERGSDAVSQATSFSLEDYYHRMVGSVGVKSANVHRSVSFNEAMADKLGEQRDNLSAVSLDEEMINMMKYQHAYTVASKLLSVADELLMTLINSKR